MYTGTVGENIILPPKYEIIMVPSNHSNFQYCDSNIGLFSIAPLKLSLFILFVSFLVTIAIVGRAITLERKPSKISKEMLPKRIQRGLRVITLQIAILEN